MPLPPELAHLGEEYDGLQFTLVDCPGHASLIRTVLGGAQIIDLMLLVIDVTKGALMVSCCQLWTSAKGGGIRHCICQTNESSVPAWVCTRQTSKALK